MTVRQLSFHPDAIEEAEAAARWYRQRSARAAGRFVDELNDAVDRIVDVPQRWPLGPRGTRKVKLPCFPILVIIDRLTLRFRFLRLRTVDDDRITGKPDSSISAPFYCFSHACKQPVFEWV